MSYNPPASIRTKLAILEGRQMWAFGHSYIFGSGGGDLAKRLFYRHNADASLYATRTAAGTTAGYLADQIRQLGFTANGASGGAILGTCVVMSMINNVNGSHTSSTVVEEYRSIFAQLTSVRLGITTSAFTFGSGWASGVTSTVGSYFDFSWQGDTAYVAMAFTTAAATVTVSRSGTGGAIQSTVSTGGFSEAFPGVVKLSGFGPGNHTVRIALASGSGATVYFGLMPTSAPPTVLWLQEGSLSSYTTPQNTLLTSTYPTAVAAIVADFPTVRVIATDNQWSPSTMLYGDGVHLNDRGIAYWVERIEDDLRKLDFRYGQNAMTTNTTPSYLPLPITAYSSSTLNLSTNYTNLKTWASDNSYVYSLGTDFAAVPVGAGLVVTGGTGWTAGSYMITNVFLGFGTPDGTRNMYQFGSAQPRAAAAGTAGGAGYLTI